MKNENRPFFSYTPESLRKQAWFSRELYPFEANFCPTRHGQMHYVDEGQGRAVLLLHGTPGWSFEYHAVIQNLSAAGCRVIAPDFLGFGLSERPRARYSFDFHRECLNDLLAHLALDSIHLVSHDMSGPVAWPLITARPEQFRSVSLINTWAWSFYGSVDGFEKMAGYLKGRLMKFLYLQGGFSTRILLPSALGKTNDRRIKKHMSAMMPNARSRVGTYGVVQSLVDPEATPPVEQFTRTVQALNTAGLPPVSLIWGMKDRLLPENFISVWQNSRAVQSVHRITEASHFPQLTHAHEVSQLVSGFIQKHSHAPEVSRKRSPYR